MDLIANTKKYGFAHTAHEDACKKDDQDYCYPESLKEPDAEQTHIFAGGEYMTTHVNALLADYALKQLDRIPLH